MTAQRTQQPVLGSRIPSRTSWRHACWRLLIRNDVEYDCRVGCPVPGCMHLRFIIGSGGHSNDGLGSRKFDQFSGNTAAHCSVWIDSRDVISRPTQRVSLLSRGLGKLRK